MARIVVVERAGPPETLGIVDAPAQEPGAGEVRLRVAAFALNRGDALYRSGHYFEQPGTPGRIGYDCAGVVEAVGAGVPGFAPGDRVATLPAFSQNTHGVYGEWAVVPANSLMPWPQGLSAAEAAALGTQYFTGCFALFEVGGLRAGDPVLVTAGGSGTGTAAVQLAKAAGAVVITTTRQADKVASLRENGADHVIVTSQTSLADGVRAAIGEGVPLIVDCVGGKDFGALPDAARPGGRIVSYGFLAGSDLSFSALPFYRKGLHVRFVQVFQMTGLPMRGLPQQRDGVERAIDLIRSGVASGTIHPRVGREFPLEQIVEAHQLMESNQQLGKIVVTLA